VSILTKGGSMMNNIFVFWALGAVLARVVLALGPSPDFQKGETTAIAIGLGIIAAILSLKEKP
jgi:glycerol uptake facilitator-like aquaporin